MKLSNYNSTKSTDFCSSFFKIGLLYEYYTNDLKLEISDRRKFNLFYKESEILYILDCLVNALHYLKSKSVPSHGDIRPYNVLLNKTGQIKLGE